MRFRIAARSLGATGQNPPAGQWVWQEKIYSGGGGYWAFIKPQDFSNYRGFHTPGGP